MDKAEEVKIVEQFAKMCAESLNPDQFAFFDDEIIPQLEICRHIKVRRASEMPVDVTGHIIVMDNENVGEILQKIYDSEIHLRIGWLWDGGLDYSIGTTSNDMWDSDWNRKEIVYTGNNNLKDAIIEMAQEIAKQYPNSAFTEWFNGILTNQSSGRQITDTTRCDECDYPDPHHSESCSRR